MKRNMSPRGTGRSGELRPVLLLLIVVVVPMVCVLWFLRVAMENERLAGRQRLSNAYQVQLIAVGNLLDSHWQSLTTEIEAEAAGIAPQQLFAEVTSAGRVGAIVCYHQGQLIYPQEPPIDEELAGVDDGPWNQAEQLENEQSDFLAAADAYEQIAISASDAHQQARALQSQARCLLRAGRQTEAVALVANTLSKEEFAGARDRHQRLIVPNAELMALEQMENRESAEFRKLQNRLIKRLANYQQSELSSSQRLFLMKRMVERNFADSFPTMNAEDLAANFVAVHPIPAKDSSLRQSQLADVWQLAMPNGNLLLLTTKQIVSQSAEIAIDALSKESRVRTLPPGETDEQAFLVTSAGTRLPGWQLSLRIDESVFDSAVAQQNTLYPRLFTRSIPGGVVQRR